MNQKKSVKTWVWILGGVTSGLILFGLVCTFWVVQQKRVIEQAWTDFSQRFPKTETNDSGLKLQELTAQLGTGVIMEIPETEKKLTVDAVHKKRFESLQESLNTYLETQLENKTQVIAAPPENLQRYLTEQAANLKAIRTHLIQSKIPQWKLDVNQWSLAYALPNITGIVNLQKLLTLEILEKIRLKQDQEAIEILEASWNLNQSLRSYPQLITQLAVLINDNYLAGVIRKLNIIPGDLQPKITALIQLDYTTSLLIGLESEFISIARTTQQAFEGKGENAATPWLFEKLYVQISMADFMKRGLRGVKELAQQDICDFDVSDFSRRHPLSAKWNTLGKTSPNFWEQWPKSLQRRLDWELTLKVIQAKQIAVTNSGKWANQIPGINHSICKKRKWKYKVNSDREMSISYNKVPLWFPEQKSGQLILPLKYEENQ